MFLNICSLIKIWNGIKVNLVFEVDLFVNDIDICVVFEIYLRRIVLDLVVVIINYIIYRRDWNWFDNDKWEKGGVVIYVRKNVKVKLVLRLELLEFISLVIELLFGYYMLMCGIYYLLRFKY